MLEKRVGRDMLGVFLAQIGCQRYSSWVIGALWGMSAREVTGYRRALTEKTDTLIPEVRHLAADATLKEVHRKERVA